MSRSPEQVIRRYLDEHGDLDEVAVDHLLVSWRIDELTPSARALIGAALASVGVRVDPPLSEVSRRGTVALSVMRPGAEAAPRRPPPWDAEAPPAAEPEAPASETPVTAPRPPRRRSLRVPKLPRLPQRSKPQPSPPPPAETPPAPTEAAPPEPPAEPASPPEGDRADGGGPFAFLLRFARPRALVAGGGLAAFIALWVPWVEWSSPAVVTLDFERTGDAWRALGAEPWAIFLALVFGLAVLADPRRLPDGWRSPFAGVTSAVALALGALGVLISAINIVSPADSAVYTETELRGGPFLALAGSIALVAGVWLARPDAQAQDAPGLTRTTPGTEST